jgi:DNA polymerase III subunit delta'
MPPFSRLLGQPQAVELLTQALHKQRIAPAYLFAGADGVGRKLAAECFMELLFSQGKNSEHLAVLRSRIQQRNHPDLFWVEPSVLHQGKRFSPAEAIEAGIKRKTAPIIRLEQIREITRFLARPPLEAQRAVVVLEQAETMAEAPANALLKTLEEPGKATLILLAPTVESLLPTLVSRCQRVPFYRLAAQEMAEVLQTAGYGEILHQPQILQLAQGSPGAAIAHWQQLQDFPTELLAEISQPPHSHRAALSLARQIDQSLEPETQLWLIDYLQHLYWQRLTIAPPIAATSSAAMELLPLQQLEKAREHLRNNVQPRLVWEVTLMSIIAR